MDEKCAAQHFGPWLVEPQWMHEAITAVKSGLWKPNTPAAAPAPPDLDHIHASAAHHISAGQVISSIDTSGIVTIPISGSLTKHQSSFGGSSMMDVRRAIVRADNDPDVRGIMLVIDSPGGTVSGTFDLADTVQAVEKPVHAYAQDMMASAALAIGTQADHISANRTAEIGSIGTVCQVVDTSKAYEMAGIKVHTISTGTYKGAFADGAEITDEQLDYLQERINEINRHFIAAVALGREMEKESVEELATGEVWLAAKAMKNGLIDIVESLDDAYARLEAAADAHFNPPMGGKNMAFGKTKEPEKDGQRGPVETMDALEEAFDGIECKDTLVMRAFRAGVEPEAAASIAGPIKAALAAKDRQIEETRQDCEDLQADLERNQAEIDDLHKQMKAGNAPVDEPSEPTDGGFMERVRAHQEDKDCTRGEAIAAVQAAHPDLHTQWLAAQASQGITQD